jgi:hypothetical protein
MKPSRSGYDIATRRQPPRWEGIEMDDTMRAVVVAAVEQAVSALLDALVSPATLGLAQAAHLTRVGVLAIGARVLEAGLVARGTGKVDARLVCACGAQATFEGYRTKST